MKRLILLLTLSLLMTMSLVACGGGEAASETSETSEVSEAPAAEGAAAVCEDSIGCVEIAAGDPIIIATAMSISGDTADLGSDEQRGVEIALAERGQMFGRELQLQAEDDGCNAEGGQTSATKIVANPQVVGIIGTTCSGAGVPASKIMSDAGYVMISPSNTSPALTDPAQSWQPGYLRTAANDLVQAAAMAEFAYNELGVRKAAAIHDGDPYTDGLAQAFANSFTALGGEVVAVEAESKDATNVEPLLTTIGAKQPEFLFMPVFMPLGGLLFNTAKTIPGLETTILAAADGLQTQTLVDAAGENVEGAYFSGPNLQFSNAAYTDQFVPAYEAAYGEAPISVYHAHAYDATNMLLAAIEKVAIEGEDGALFVPRQALRDALYATAGFEGLTGTLSCTPNGDCADADIAIQQLQGGAFVPVWSSKAQ